MNISTELLIGIVLIGMGLLLAAAAYMVLSSRKDDQDDLEEDQDDEFSSELEEEEETDVADVPDVDELTGDDDLLDEPDTPDGGAPDIDEVEDFDEVEEHVPEPEAEVDEPVGPELEVPEADEIAPEPESGPRIQVATLLRDEVSGELIVQVGDREYRSADDLRDSQDWTRVEFAASDLTKWIDQPVARPTPEREGEVADHAKPMSMIEQINEILQEKIEESGQSHLAVRLIEGTEGTARVLIGVHSYELGEVPDEAISNLIREAVADWEAGN